MAKAGKEKAKAKPAAKGKDDADVISVVARNRRARFEYDLMETFEAGIGPDGDRGQERSGPARRAWKKLTRCVEREEVWLYGCDIPEYLQANRMNHKAKRPRKLLLHRKEIDRLETKTSERGLTIVPLRKSFSKKGWPRSTSRSPRGESCYDKREALKKAGLQA